MNDDEACENEVSPVKYVYTFLSAVCVLLICMFPQTVHAADEIMVDTDTLNVRAGQGTQFDSIGTLYKGETYEIVQVADEWIEIVYNNQQGWVSKDYVIIQDTDNEQLRDDDLMEFKTSIDNMYIRTEPSSSSSISQLFDKGTKCSVLEKTSEQWYQVSCDDHEGYMFSKHILESPSIENENMRDKTIVIDAGHGGRDVGSIGVNGTYEKDLTLKTALALKDALQALGARVHMTRDDDSYVLLESRPMYANTVRADAFISIHYNSFPDVPSVTGIGTYYYEGQDQFLASSLQHAVSLYSESRDRGIEHGDYQVLRTNIRPSALIELGFISNAYSEELLLTAAYQDKLVHGIVNGLSSFFAGK